jgi:hypothetical protein
MSRGWKLVLVGAAIVIGVAVVLHLVAPSLMASLAAYIHGM